MSPCIASPVRATLPGLLPTLLAAYLGTRLWHLGALPMFIDEGTYIVWGLHALHADRLDDLLYSIPDGKQPLLAWLMAPLLAVVPDRLLAARLTAVAAGAAGAAGAYALCRRLYGTPTGLLAGALYVLAPLTFFYDRLAIYDGLIAACGLVSLATAVWWLDRASPLRTLLLGIVLALTALTKVSALLIALAAPLAALALLPHRRALWWRATGAYAVAGVAFGALLLHPGASMLYQGAADRSAFTPTDLIALPWRVWESNLRHLATSLAGYLPTPLWILYLCGLLLPLLTRDRRDAVLAAWCLLLLGSTLILDKVFYFRYYVPGAVAGLLPTARVLALLAARLATLFPTGTKLFPLGDNGTRLTSLTVLLVATAPSLPLLWALWHDPYGAPLPGDRIGDREQYVLSRHAGWETEKLVDFLRARVAEEPIAVVVSPLTGHMRAWVESRLLFLPGAHVLLRDPRQTPRAQVLDLPPEEEIRRLAVGGGTVFFATSEWATTPAEQPYRENDDPDAALVLDAPRHDLPWRHRVYRLQFPQELRRVRFPRPLSFGARREIALLGYDLQPPVSTQTTSGTSGSLGPASSASAPLASQGSAHELTLFWRAERSLSRSFTVFVHVVTAKSDGRVGAVAAGVVASSSGAAASASDVGATAPGAGARLVAQHDGIPGEGTLPTDRWRPGASIRDRHLLSLPATAACERYRIRVGLYERETLKRLPAATAPGHLLGVAPATIEDAVEIGDIEASACANP